LTQRRARHHLFAVSFPYPLPDLDLGAPFDRHRAVVRPEWIDANGHMNVGYYVIAFDHATDTFAEQLGVAWPYVEHRLGMTFILEAHVTYERELTRGDPLRVTTQILDFDEKRLHFFHAMHHGADGFLAAANELLMIHVDFASRRAAPWPAETLRRIQAMAAAHAALPRPDRAGRVIAIRRGRR
jgi:acyl-CoA thioester hydrolase